MEAGPRTSQETGLGKAHEASGATASVEPEARGQVRVLSDVAGQGYKAEAPCPPPSATSTARSPCLGRGPREAGGPGAPSGHAHLLGRPQRPVVLGLRPPDLQQAAVPLVVPSVMPIF